MGCSLLLKYTEQAGINQTPENGGKNDLPKKFTGCYLPTKAVA